MPDVWINALKPILHHMPKAWNFTDLIRGELTRQYLKNDAPPLLVASPGKSGSTMLCQSLVHGKCISLGQPEESWMWFIPAWVPERTTFRRGGVYKTHWLPIGIPNNVKTIFIYDDPINIIGSLKRIHSRGEVGWLRRHADHFKYAGHDFHNLLHRDVFRIADYLRFWFSSQRFPILRVHYRDLWRRKEDIETFVGHAVLLPEYVARINYKELLDETEMASFHETYAEAQSIIDKASVAQ